MLGLILTTTQSSK